MKTIVYEGKVCIPVRVAYYCKAGAYDHKTRYGWELQDEAGNVIKSGAPYPVRSAADHAMPKFKTRKELLACILE